MVRDLKHKQTNYMVRDFWHTLYKYAILSYMMEVIKSVELSHIRQSTVFVFGSCMCFTL